MARLPERGAAAAARHGAARQKGSHVKMTLMLLVVLAGVASIINLAPSSLHAELHARSAGAELRQLTGEQRNRHGWHSGRLVGMCFPTPLVLPLAASISA